MIRRVISLLLCCTTLLLNLACSTVRTANTTQRGTPEAQDRLPDREGLDPTRDGVGDVEYILAAATFDRRVIEFDAPGAVLSGRQTGQPTLVGRVQGEQLVVGLNEVERIWVQRQGRSTLTNLAIALGVIVLAAGVVVVIALATKESCPFVYSWDGQRYVFDAEPYGGAISRGLERDDYGMLEHLRADGDVYRLRLANEVNETQYTNLLELWAVDHAPGTRLACDEWGGLHVLRAPAPPTAAIDDRGEDLRGVLAAVDRLVYEPMPDPAAGVSFSDTAAPPARGSVTMSFARPEGATRARLVVRASTGMWGSHMIRELLTLRGTDLDAWHATIDADEAARQQLREWSIREELYVLKLEVEEPDGWHVRGMLPGGGPFVAEDRVVTLDVSRVVGDELHVRVRPPAGFWALDAFAAEFDGPTGLGVGDVDPSLQVTRLQPTFARTDAGEDVLATLLHADDGYHVMPHRGDGAEVRFPAPTLAPGLERTTILRTRGYYRLHLQPTGPPDLATLQELAMVPDSAARLAARLYGQRSLAGAP